MGSSGEVPSADVEYVLRAHRVKLCHKDMNELCVTAMSTGDMQLSMVLQPMVGRRVLQLLKRKFDIPIHHLCHPLEAPTDQDSQVN